MKKSGLLPFFALVLAFSIFSSCCILSKNPVLKGTRWTAVQEMFVADAGTMTIHHTLDFLSDKEVLVLWESYLPAHPAMRMSPDGTVDTIPASSSESKNTCTYTFEDGILTVTTQKGLSESYIYQKDGTFTRQESWGETIVFSRVKK